jgi:molybdopterin/thiamine biosynthesis adenylyltransferase
MNNQPDDYYARQISLPEFGPAGQQRLKDSRVLVVGAGGLGSPILMALAGAGVGHLTIQSAHPTSIANFFTRLRISASPRRSSPVCGCKPTILTWIFHRWPNY